MHSRTEPAESVTIGLRSQELVISRAFVYKSLINVRKATSHLPSPLRHNVDIQNDQNMNVCWFLGVNRLLDAGQGSPMLTCSFVAYCSSLVRMGLPIGHTVELR
jgi:hypothetical protein